MKNDKEDPAKMTQLSRFGQKFARHSGISRLMQDLNEGIRTPEAVMLGGGNPAHIPEMDSYFHQLLQEMVNNGSLSDAVCNYDGPQGKDAMLNALAICLKEKLGWNIGYADAGLEEDLFVANKPTIEMLPDGQFKYHVDFEHLTIGDDIGAICVSRPTNPTGNVITDDEVKKLDALAKKHDIPLIIDNAYGVPFPGIIFSQATPHWNDNTILCMSLSKLGLPGARCGIIIANEELITAITNVNGIISLAPGGIGPAMALEMLKRDDLMRLSQEIIRSFYHQRVLETIDIIRRYLPKERCLIHKPEGAIFLWLWFKDLPISSEELYRRLKKRGVLMVPGHYFFPGLEESWQHAHQCMRMNYVPEPALIEKGIKILSEEIEHAYRQNK